MADQAAAARLRQARIAAGHETVADAAKALNVEYPTYAGHENGSRGFTDDAPTYAQAFKVRADWLLTGRGDMKGDDLAGLTPENRAKVVEYIELLKIKQGQ